MAAVTVAAVQATPVFLDREGTVAKVGRLTREAARLGAKLIVFPETFVPTYPDWVWRAPAWGEAFEALTARLREQAVTIPSAATDAMAKAAKAARAWVSVGVNELEPTGGTLYNTQITYSPDGAIAGRHRKLMPTGGERLVWGLGDGSDLEVHETAFGRVGGLICWENLMPLARVAMYAKGIDIWTAPTWDNGENWVANLRHIAREGRCYVIGVTTVLRGSDIPDDVPGRELWGGAEDLANDGWSAIVDPDGQLLAGPLVGEEGILTAEVDADRVRAERYKFDPIGHYARPDVFRLVVNEDPKPSVASE
jgi:nitrilase